MLFGIRYFKYWKMYLLQVCFTFNFYSLIVKLTINNGTLYVVQVLMDLNTGRKQKLNGGNASTEVVALILIEWF